MGLKQLDAEKSRKQLAAATMAAIAEDFLWN